MNDGVNLAQGEFRLNPRYRLQWEDAQNCHVLLYPEGLIKLNESAAEILRRCQEPVSQEELARNLRRDFPAAEGLEQDVAEFLEHARAQEWLVRGQDN